MTPARCQAPPWAHSPHAPAPGGRRLLGYPPPHREERARPVSPCALGMLCSGYNPTLLTASLTRCGRWEGIGSAPHAPSAWSLVLPLACLVSQSASLGSGTEDASGPSVLGVCCPAGTGHFCPEPWPSWRAVSGTELWVLLCPSPWVWEPQGPQQTAHPCAPSSICLPPRPGCVLSVGAVSAREGPGVRASLAFASGCQSVFLGGVSPRMASFPH